MRIEGGAALAKALDQLPLKTSPRVMRSALRQGGEVIRAHAASIAPRAPGAPDIADNIGMSTARAQDNDVAAIKVGPTKPGFAYGVPLEFGTANMGAQPFMRPAFDTERERALEAIRQALWKALIALGVVASARTSSGGDDSR